MAVSVDEDLCDAVIIVDEESFPINKLRLSTCSPYFRALLLTWCQPDTKVFKIRGLSSDVMRLIVDFANGSLVSVTEDNVEQLFIAADYFVVTDILQACSHFLEERLAPENCVGIWKLTDVCSPCPELRCRAYQCIIDTFEEVVSNEEFQLLSVQELADLLVRDDLNIRESRLCAAILQWIAHAPKERTGHLTALLSKVRLALMDDITSLMCNELLRRNEESMQIVRDAIRFKRRMDLNTPPLTVCRNTIARPRLPNAIFLAFGGSWTRTFDAYDVRADRWVHVEVPQWPCIYPSTAVLHDDIYCVGGKTLVKNLKSLVRFDMKTSTWHEVEPMHEIRSHCALTVLNGCLYAMGGEGWDPHRTAERYSPETSQWSLIAPMNDMRMSSSCTTLNDKVYICGGYNGHETLKTCEYYSPDMNQWTMFTSMGSRREGLGVVAYADQIFAVGGKDCQSVFRSVEAYDPTTNTWHEVTPMFSKRSHFGIGVVGKKLLAVGGYSGHVKITSTSEFYEASAARWFPACSVASTSCQLSFCVVPRLPNMTGWTIPRDSLPYLHLE